MFSEIVLPSSELADFVKGYYLVNVENNDEEACLNTFETGISLGVPLGRPFFYYAGKTLDEFEEVPYKIFDKPLLFWDSKSIECFSVLGNARAVFIVLTDLGIEMFLNERQLVCSEPVFPINRIGIPIFNLIVKRKLRLNHDNFEGIKIIEDELIRFFKRFSKDGSTDGKMEIEQNDNGGFPFVS